MDGSDATLFSRDSISRLSDVTSEIAPATGAPAAWTVVGADIRSEVRGTLRDLEGSSGDVSLAIATHFEASRVDAIEVVIAGLQPAAQPELLWLLESEAECKTCSVRLLWRDAEGARRDIFRFEVGSRSSWTGVVSRLVLRPTNIRGNRVQVEQVRLLERRADRERLNAASGHTFLVTAGDETRPATLFSGVEPVRMPFAPLAGDRLRFGFAREATSRYGQKLRVFAQTSSGEVHQIAKIDVPEATSARGWQDHEVQLDEFGEDELDLMFAVEGGPDITSLRELSYLGTPELVRRTRTTERRPNVLLVSIDTLRADRLSTYGYDRPTSPLLDEWVRTSGATVFERAVAAAASTLPAHASMFSGVEVMEHGAYLGYPLAPRFDLLAEILRDAGYRTAAVTGGGYLHPRFGLAQGFDRFIHWPRGQSSQGNELEDGVAATERWLREESSEPFFFFFHTYEVHAPYTARQPFFSSVSTASPNLLVQPWLRKEREEDGYLSRDQWPKVWGDGEPRDLKEDERALLDDLYDSGVARVDGALARVLAALRSSGKDENTIVIVTSDHGEALGESDFFNHGFLYDHNLLVPLIVRDPAHRRGSARVSRQVRQIDLLPTILELLSLPRRAGIDGVSLASWLTEGRGVSGLDAWSYAPETNHGLSLRRDRMKFILRDSILGPVGTGAYEAYDLSADPAEVENLAADDPSRLAGLSRLAFSKLGEAASGMLIEWRNPGSHEATGYLVWNGARRHNAKLMAPTEGLFRMRVPGKLEFRMPAGSVARTRFMTPRESVRYQLQVAEANAQLKFTGEILVDQLCERPRSLTVGAEEKGATKQPVLAVVISILGGCIEGASSDRIDDADLAAGLRALGYLN